MKTSNTIALGIILLAVTVAAVCAKKRADNKRMLNQIADEGYETAHDVLFPGKRLRIKNLRYGPVIPVLA